MQHNKQLTLIVSIMLILTIMLVTVLCLNVLQYSPTFLSLLGIVLASSAIISTITTSIQLKKDIIGDRLFNRLIETQDIAENSKHINLNSDFNRYELGPSTDIPSFNKLKGKQDIFGGSKHTNPVLDFNRYELETNTDIPYFNKLIEKQDISEYPEQTSFVPDVEEYEIISAIDIPYFNKLIGKQDISEWPEYTCLGLDVNEDESRSTIDISSSDKVNPEPSLSLDQYLELNNFRLTTEIIEKIEWKRFELLCHLIFKASGFKSHLTNDGAD